jgi:hypothetical protein
VPHDAELPAPAVHVSVYVPGGSQPTAPPPEPLPLPPLLPPLLLPMLELHWFAQFWFSHVVNALPALGHEPSSSFDMQADDVAALRLNVPLGQTQET